ncbi:MAG TPA: phosphopantothenoylcysteine decarboxylase [Chthoniobacterales bacterium]|nr:phosphopantothenoylcysteine decarboxylase [Chthoniobacterales bacterium]
MRFLITAGPTREPIDPVRYLSNRSSGKMGYAIAEAAIEAGHEVILISGPVNVARPRGAAVVPVSTSEEMFDAVVQHTGNCDILVMSAAVADYKPAKVSRTKIKKREADLSLELKPTRDILSSLPKNRRYLVVGFAAETDDIEANARKKLHAKNCDIVVANDARTAMESDENEVTVLFSDDQKKKISRALKKIVARELVKIFENVREKCLTKKIM